MFLFQIKYCYNRAAGNLMMETLVSLQGNSMRSSVAFFFTQLILTKHSVGGSNLGHCGMLT